VHSRAERVFILEHYFASKSFAAVCEAFSNAYSDKEVPNKTTLHRLVTTFRDTGNMSDVGQCWQVRRSATLKKHYKLTRLPCYTVVNKAFKILLYLEIHFKCSTLHVTAFVSDIISFQKCTLKVNPSLVRFSSVTVNGKYKSEFKFPWDLMGKYLYLTNYTETHTLFHKITIWYINLF
jgi:hypothetical protein